MRLLARVLCLGSVLLLASCAAGPRPFGVWPRVPVAPPPGFIYTHYHAPLQTNMERTPASGLKVGKASTTAISVWLFSFAWDDASIEKAAQNGGITKIHYADYEFMQVLGVYGKFTTTVYGE